ncbi:hypothetical protein MHEC_45220 [Mycobacterium heckeshornense]|uniref:Uncharacterized protein n=1 Tax=Mycobacterium heckeshornense TaxID=110505 RepID=A0A7R7GXX0_9MYCO|nr:hypothetical protein MHEC_45220 [Mycobacterium heckeshornense]
MAQLPKIAVDLENIAATLAEAQRSCATLISTLETQLTDIDQKIGAAEDLETTSHLSAADKEAVDQLIASLEHTAIDDTKSTLAQLQSIRAGYSDYLQKSLASLRTDGYDPDAIHGVDAEQPKDPVPGDIPPSGLETTKLADIKRLTNQAVLDQMAKVRAAQKAIDDAAATAYTTGQGSPEGQAALARLPQLTKNLADALIDLGKLPDYSNIDPSTLRSSPDGRFIFGYTVDGQPVQVTGQLKNGTGEIFDQRTQTYYTFTNGKLTGIRTLDEGRAIPDDQLLQNAFVTAVGAGPTLVAGKAGAEAAWQGLKALFTREGRAADAAESRAHAVAQSLTTDHPLHFSPTTNSEHPTPLTASEHPAGPTAHEPAQPGGGPHTAPIPGSEVPHPLPSDSPLFHGYHPIEPGPEFTRADGSLIYPDDSLPSKPYAIPSTVIPDAHLPAGTELGRFGYPGGSYLAPEGTPFAQLSLPRKAPPNRITDTSSTTPQHSHPAGTSNNPKQPHGFINPAAAHNTELLMNSETMVALRN